SGNAMQAVKQGFIGSSTVVVAAALIMTSVFAAFIPEGSVQIKPIAIGLTAGIAADAFLVRMTLIPALMAWLGEKAWWLPDWIERSLPMVDVEGEGLHRTLEHEDWIAINGESQVRVSNLQIISHEDEIISNLSFALKNGELAVIRSEDRVARKALAAILTARLQPSSGIVAIGRNVLPDGTGLVQGQSAVIDRWNALLPRHVQVVIIDDPGGRRWKRVSELLSEGKAVVVTGPRNLEVPEFIQVHTNQEIINTKAQLQSSAVINAEALSPSSIIEKGAEQ
ncbi:MAG: MMPL family transporter, partial [Arcanobacterium sp.]|nr:MMPL family transporter [Arcanobacterium sp.]